LADAPTRRNRVRTLRKDKNWYAGRVRIRTPIEEDEGTREEKNFRVDCENAEAARFSGWLDKSGRC